jgi:hypothetical protein
MKQVKAADFPRNDEAGYPCVGWSLDDDHKVSFGRDGDSGTWIVYLGLPGDDLHCEVPRDEIRNLGRMLVQMVDDADSEEEAELAATRANVDARRRSLWSRR